MTRQIMLAFLYKLAIGAQKSWRRLRGFEHLAKVIAGVKFKDGLEVMASKRTRQLHQPAQAAA